MLSMGLAVGKMSLATASSVTGALESSQGRTLGKYASRATVRKAHRIAALRCMPLAACHLLCMGLGDDVACRASPVFPGQEIAWRGRL